MWTHNKFEVGKRWLQKTFSNQQKGSNRLLSPCFSDLNNFIEIMFEVCKIRAVWLLNNETVCNTGIVGGKEKNKYRAKEMLSVLLICLQIVTF